MAAIKLEDLERLEKEHGLSPDGLTYQHRCSRITAYLNGKGDEWTEPEKRPKRTLTERNIKASPIYGKKLLITPLMVPDANRNLAFDEPLGPDVTVRDFNAGEQIYGAAEDVQRMVGDYEIVNVDRTKQVMGKTTFPKVGTEITYRPGVDLVPVVRGNDNKVGYIWSFPTSIQKTIIDDEEYAVQLYGLKSLIRTVYPELEPQFSGKPMMDYVDGVTLVASIPQTHALLKKHRRQELADARAGLI